MTFKKKLAKSLRKRLRKELTAVTAFCSSNNLRMRFDSRRVTEEAPYTFDQYPREVQIQVINMAYDPLWIKWGHMVSLATGKRYLPDFFIGGTVVNSFSPEALLNLLRRTEPRDVSALVSDRVMALLPPNELYQAQGDSIPEVVSLTDKYEGDDDAETGDEGKDEEELDRESDYADKEEAVTEIGRNMYDLSVALSKEDLSFRVDNWQIVTAMYDKATWIEPLMTFVYLEDHSVGLPVRWDQLVDSVLEPDYLEEGDEPNERARNAAITKYLKKLSRRVAGVNEAVPERKTGKSGKKGLGY